MSLSRVHLIKQYQSIDFLQQIQGIKFHLTSKSCLIQIICIWNRQYLRVKLKSPLTNDVVMKFRIDVVQLQQQELVEIQQNLLLGRLLSIILISVLFLMLVVLHSIVLSVHHYERKFYYCIFMNILKEKCLSDSLFFSGSASKKKSSTRPSTHKKGSKVSGFVITIYRNGDHEKCCYCKATSLNAVRISSIVQSSLI